MCCELLNELSLGVSLLRCYGCRDGTVLGRGLFNMILWVICVIGIAVDNLDCFQIGMK